MLTRRKLIALGVATCVVSGCAGSAGPVTLEPGTRLIVVRHADRDGENLSARGIARAKALVSAVQDIEIDAIYTLGIQRNLDTAAPLAEARDLPINRIAHDNYARRILDGNQGKTVIWVGNKGNIAEIWESLRIPDPAPLEYGDLHILERTAQGGIKVTRLRFGEDQA